MIYCHRNLLWCFQNGWLMVLIFFPDYIDNPRGKKQPQRSSLGLNYGPITSSMDDKIGGRRPRRPNFTQGEMNEWLFHSVEKLDVYLIFRENSHSSYRKHVDFTDFFFCEKKIIFPQHCLSLNFHSVEMANISWN